MEIKYTVYQKFYFTLLNKFKELEYAEEFQKDPNLRNKYPKNSPKWWERKKTISGKSSFIVTFKFSGFSREVGALYFYNKLLELKKPEDSVDIDELTYFKGLMYIGLGIKEGEDFESLYFENKSQWIKGNSSFDVFDQKYRFDILQELHLFFAEEYLPGYSDETLEINLARFVEVSINLDSVTELLNDAQLEFNKIKIDVEDKKILYRYIFDQANPITKRLRAVNIFCVQKMLTDDEIINLLHCPVKYIHETAMKNLFEFTSPQNNTNTIIKEAIASACIFKTHSLLYYNILVDAMKIDFLRGLDIAERVINLSDIRRWNSITANGLASSMIHFINCKLFNYPYIPDKYSYNISIILEAFFYRLSNNNERLDLLKELTYVLHHKQPHLVDRYLNNLFVSLYEDFNITRDELGIKPYKENVEFDDTYDGIENNLNL